MQQAGLILVRTNTQPRSNASRLYVVGKLYSHRMASDVLRRVNVVQGRNELLKHQKDVTGILLFYGSDGRAPNIMVVKQEG